MFLFILLSKPLVCLFSTLFQNNLLTFLHRVQSALPETTVLRLLKCLTEDSPLNPWVSALSKLLERKLELRYDEPLCTEQCSVKLKEMFEGSVGYSAAGWTQCLNHQIVKPESQIASEAGTQRKRPGSFVHLDDADDEETRRESKRIKWNIFDDELDELEDGDVKNQAGGGSESAATAGNPAPDNLPENLRVNQGRSTYCLYVTQYVSIWLELFIFCFFRLLFF